MAQPVWITPAGSLGTIPEGIFYQTAMLADTAIVATIECTATSSVTNRITCTSTTSIWPGLNVMFTGTVFGGLNPGIRYFVLEVVNSTQFTLATTEFSTTPISLNTETGTMTAEFRQHVYFSIQAGALPSGIQIADNGLIIGVPKAVASIQGVPTQVAEDVTSKFTVRGYTKTRTGLVDRISDRTFSLTVTGQDTPEWVTPAGQLAQEYDGQQITPIQVEYTDVDPTDTVYVTLKAGSLPPGLSISLTGLITGFITPLSPVSATAGFSRDGQGYSIYPFDFSTRSVNTNYEFVLELSDGKSSNLRTFSIFVYSKDSMTADTTDITADNTFVTADVSPVRTPFIVSPAAGSIGIIRSDNFYAVQFVGLDLDGDPVTYSIGYDVGEAHLPGLTLDPGTGWLYGFIPNLGLTDNTYNFYIRVYKQGDPTVISDRYDYSLEIIGPIDTDVTWLVDSDLGTIVNGATSTLYVAATNTAGIPLQYQLESGSNSNLPQGLQLLPSGDIAGRVSFNTFALDLGATTFDVTLNDLALTGQNTETTFDMSHTFTVNAYSVNGLVSVYKTFTITVDRVYDEPYENLYIQAMPPQDDRNLISSLLQNQDIFQPDLIYRPTDPNFGLSTKVVYNHAFGLTASTIDDYVSSLNINHYWKNVTLGEIRVAQAVDANGEVIYEVIYSPVIDNLLNSDGDSVSKEVTLPYPINENDSTEISVVYPNSLIDMRDQVIDTVGQVADILPLWMTSKQSDGQVLGFTPSWVLAYAKPNKGNQIAYYIRTKFGERLNLVDFEIDRYELDRLLTKNWDPIADSVNGHWIPAPPEYTTFDVDTEIVEWQNDDGNTVVWVDNEGGSVNWANGFESPTGTTFDENSLKFIAPVDMYSNSTEYDKYLVFPRRTILG